MFAMKPGPERHDSGMVFQRPIPRCFELKTSKITRDGQVKSLKEGKFHKTRAQLEILCDFGSPQTFLLEAFIVEAGFSRTNHYNSSLPPAVRESTARKCEQITRADYGYVVLPIEQIPGFAEEHTGMAWPAVTLKGAE